MPRSAEEIDSVLRADANLQSLRPDLQTKIEALADNGLLVKCKDTSDPGQLVAHLPKAAFPYADESKRLYEKRLKHPKHAWRMNGDIWICSNDGLDLLKAADDGPKGPMTPTEIQAQIDEHWKRTIPHSQESYNAAYGGADKPDGPSLVDHFLETEFLDWATAVQKDCDERWNVKVMLPLAGGAGYADAYELNLIDAENQKTALGAVVDPWFMALTILAFTDTDTGTTADDGSHKPTYTGYARKSVAGTDMGTASAGAASNTSAIIFAACTAGSSVITGCGNCSTVTVGLLRKYGTCSGTINTSQTPATFAIGAYSTSVD